MNSYPRLMPRQEVFDHLIFIVKREDDEQAQGSLGLQVFAETLS